MAAVVCCCGCTQNNVADFPITYFGDGVRFASGNLVKDSDGCHFAEEQYILSPTGDDFFTSREMDSIDIDGWYLPTYNEWTMILNHSYLKFVTVCNVYGLLVVPPKWRQPENINLHNDSVFNYDQWKSMEANGAAFLPSGGYMKDSTTVVGRNVYGTYADRISPYSETRDDIIFTFLMLLGNKPKKDNNPYYDYEFYAYALQVRMIQYIN